MPIAHDANTRFPATNGTTGVDSTDTTTGDRTFSHAGSASAMGAVVMVENRTVTTAVVTGVLYGGVAMVQVDSAVDTSEAGRVSIFVLTSSVPTGTQTVTLQGCTASAKWATCSTVTADRPVGFVNSGSVDTTTAANPSVSLDTGLTSMVYGGYHDGAAAPATSGISGCTIQYQQDHGALCGGSFRLTANQAPGTFSVGVTLGSDDYCIAAVALAELLPFPTTPVLDDFNRANGALGSSWSAEPFNDGSAGFTIISNAAETAAGTFSGDAAWFNTSTYGPDSEAWMDLPVQWNSGGADETGVFLRVQSPSASSSTGDGYQAFISGTGAPFDTNVFYMTALEYYRIDNGVFTLLGATQGGAPARVGSGFGARMNGSVIQAYAGTGTTWPTLGSSRSDATYTAAGYLGMNEYQDTRSTQINNFGGGRIGRPKQARRSLAKPALATTGSFN